MRIVFMGTPQFSLIILRELSIYYDVVGVVTQPDKPVGRKKQYKLSPVKEYAIKNDVVLLQPKSIKNDYYEILKLNPDIIITAAYGQIIPKELLDFPSLGCINVHGSLLPKYRGGAPIHHALINGDKKTGITIMYMAEKMDAGDIISQKTLSIENSDNVDTLFDKMSKLGAKLLLDTLPLIKNKCNKRIKQNENEVTYAFNIKREDEFIDFNNTAEVIRNKVRGLNSWPGATCKIDDYEFKLYKIIISEIKSTKAPGMIENISKKDVFIATLDYQIKIQELKPNGKKKMNIVDFLNGAGRKIFTNLMFKEN